MAEVLGLMLRRKPKQVFTIFFTWNLSALWRRIKKLQWPWAPYNQPMKREFPRDTATQVARHTEQYLRPTPDITPYEPEIVALAVKLGMNDKSKREYAEAAYQWVKNHICTYLEVPPGGVLDVLRKGYGLCMNKMSVFVALMRVAGIPARFMSYKQEMGGGFMRMMADEMLGDTGKEIIEEILETQVTFTHGCVEILLEDEWVPADLTWTDEEETGFDMPITQFGESPFGKWYNIVPDTVTKDESIPLPSVRLSIALGVFFLRGLYDRVNERFNRIREMGKKKLEEMSRGAYMKDKKKFYVPPPRLISEDSN